MINGFEYIQASSAADFTGGSVQHTRVCVEGRITGGALSYIERHASVLQATSYGLGSIGGNAVADSVLAHVDVPLREIVGQYPCLQQAPAIGLLDDLDLLAGARQAPPVST